jgi:uncharacterized protein (TIGR02466 family)
MIEPILSQHIFSFKCPLGLKEILSSVKNLPVHSNHFNQATVDTYTLDKPEFGEVKTWVEQCLQEVLTEMKYTFQIRVTQSWVNKSEKGMWHFAHTHSNSFISGILYLTPSTSKTWFSCDSIWSPPNTLLPFYSHAKNYSELIHKFPTTPGTLLLFPSSLTHSVNEHDLEDPRYSLSFNTFPFGTFGSAGTLSELVLP